MTVEKYELNGFVDADTCKERHDKLDRVLYESPEGAFPRLRGLEMSMTKVMTAAALGSIIGGGAMSLLVALVFYALTGRGG